MMLMENDDVDDDEQLKEPEGGGDTAMISLKFTESVWSSKWLTLKLSLSSNFHNYDQDHDDHHHHRPSYIVLENIIMIIKIIVNNSTELYVNH